MMKVFISWSGERSKALAEDLRDWLPTIVQSLEPFVSTQDVPVGGRGLNVLASQLQDCSFGILCLTQENKEGPWIHFEAGALSKVIDASRVVPLLLDLKVSDLTGPLAQFQAISIANRDGIYSLIKALADQSAPPIAETRLVRLFDAFWPELEGKVSRLKDSDRGKSKQEIRSERELLEEILLLSRSTERQISSVTAVQTGEDVAFSLPQRQVKISPRSRAARALSDKLSEIGATDMTFSYDGGGIQCRITGTKGRPNRDSIAGMIAQNVAQYGFPITIRGGPFVEEVTFSGPTIEVTPKLYPPWIYLAAGEAEPFGGGVGAGAGGAVGREVGLVGRAALARACWLRSGVIGARVHGK